MRTTVPPAVAGAVVAAGTLGGLSASIAGIVYAVQGRAFDSGWIVASLVSSAICAATVVQLGQTADIEPVAMVGVVLYSVLGVWPLAWTVRSALGSAAPGEAFHPPTAASTAPRSFVAPILSLRF